MEPEVRPRQRTAAAQPFQRYVPLLAWMIGLGAILFVPFGILGHGYLPVDDALRHAAKAFSGRPWEDVLVLADWVKMDHNPGWHALLATVQRVTNWQPDSLVAFSIVFLMGLFWLLPLLWIRRVEAWLAVLVITSIALPGLLARLSFGRPLTFSAAVLMALFFLWRHEPVGQTPWRRIAASTLLIAAAAWIHGSWYLFVLPVFAFALARQWNAARWLTVCWLAGAVLGGIATGHPITFLAQAVQVPWHCFTQKVAPDFLVVEFRPSDGDVFALVVVALVLIWRTSRGTPIADLVNNAPFILMVVSWILGLKVMRFWLDWGLPSLVCWVAWQFQEAFQESLGWDSIERLGVTAALAVAFVFATVTDLNHRWSASLQQDYISATDPETAGWFPSSGGIVYNAQMAVFYRLFFTNPRGEWRYVLGFEPTFMRAENLAAYRAIQKESDRAESYAPWVGKLAPADRIVLERADQPPIPQLEWRRFGRQTWFGRLPSPRPQKP